MHSSPQDVRRRQLARQDGRRDNLRSPTCARGGSRRNTRARALEALKVVLSEIATGKRGGKVVTLVDVRRAYFYDPARRKVFVELPPEDHQTCDEHIFSGCRHSAISS